MRTPSIQAWLTAIALGAVLPALGDEDARNAPPRGAEPASDTRDEAQGDARTEGEGARKQRDFEPSERIHVETGVNFPADI